MDREKDTVHELIYPSEEMNIILVFRRLHLAGGTKNFTVNTGCSTTFTDVPSVVQHNRPKKGD